MPFDQGSGRRMLLVMIRWETQAQRSVMRGEIVDGHAVLDLLSRSIFAVSELNRRTCVEMPALDGIRLEWLFAEQTRRMETFQDDQVFLAKGLREKDVENGIEAIVRVADDRR